MFHAWQDQAAKLEQGEITKEENDQWRYKYPELDTSGHWAKVPSQAVSDMLMEELQKVEKEEKKNRKRRKHKKDLADIQYPYLKISKVFLYHLMKLFSA